jgi:5'-3' exonuclease
VEKKLGILLIDLSGLFWRAWHASGRDDVSNARRMTRDLVDKCHQGNFGGTLAALCCDRGRSFRKDLSPDYKAHRPEKDRMVLGELQQTQDDLRAAGYLLWGADGFEGDDVIATACKTALERGHDVTVASHDKDLLQLLALSGPGGEDRVRVLRTHRMAVWDRAMFVDEFGIPPYLLGDWLALTGDDSDGIRGVPGVGEKTATAMLRAFPGLSHLLAAAESGVLARTTGVKAGQARAVAQCADQIREARKIIELRWDVPILFDEIYEASAKVAQATATSSNMTEEENEMPPAKDLTDEPSQPILPLAGGPESDPAVPSPVTTSPAAEDAKVAPATTEPQKVAAGPAPEVKALVVKPTYQGPFELALEPTSLGVGMTLAERMYESRLYSRYPHQNALLVAIGRARELGFGAFAAPDLFHVIDDPKKGVSLSPLAHFIAALVERDPNCEYLMCIETDGTKATYQFKHRKHPKERTHTATIEEAVDAGLCELQVKPRVWEPVDRDGKPPKDTRGNWDKRRPEMLRATAVKQVGRIYFPNAALGLYSADEINPDYEGS